MKLMLRAEWRLRPISSFLGFFDIKTGVVIALLFALLNKVAGVYGLLAVLMGAGGSLAQLSLYIYSVVGLVALAWGLRAVQEEDAKRTLYFAHLFFADHILSTAWTVFFAVIWWVYTPHDGRRQANSAAQEEMMKHGIANNMTEEERTQAAMKIWNKEKGPAIAIITLGWLVKIYFALILYSYATHLRKGSYRSLPLSRPNPSALPVAYDTLPDEEEDIDDFYRLPLRSPHHTGGSLSNYGDFVGAPGQRRSKLSNVISNGKPIGNGKDVMGGADIEEEVLFDEDEMAGGSSLSKFGSTEESTSAGSHSDEDRPRTPYLTESGRSQSRTSHGRPDSSLGVRK